MLILENQDRVFFPGLKFKIYKQPPEVFGIVLYAVIQRFDVWLLQKAFNFLAKLATSFARNDFHLPDLFVDCIVESLLQRLINGPGIVVDVV